MSVSCSLEGVKNDKVRVDCRMSMTAFFEYLLDHPASTELSKLLAPVVMFHTCGKNFGRA